MNKNKIEERICENCKSVFICNNSSRKRFCNKTCAQSYKPTKDKIIKSQNETYKKKYNGLHITQVPEIKKKIEDSMLKKYGVKYALQNKEIMETMVKKLEESHSVSNVFQLDKIKKKSRKTKLIKYGDANYNNADKRKEYCINKYNAEHYSKTDEFKDKHYKKTYNKFYNSDKYVGIKPNFTEDEFIGVDAKKYEFVCTTCGNTFKASIDNGKIPLCKNCNIVPKSKYEIEIYEYIKSKYDKTIIINDRTVLNGLELDIYLPDINIAFEFNGLYWHSEISGHKNKFYHLNKTKKCRDANIRLIHIFENEWINKKDIVKSIISTTIGHNNVIYARKCALAEILTPQKNKFLDETHLQGNDRSTVKIGLYYNRELVSVLTFGKPRYNKNIQWEIIRYSTKLNSTVIGGLQKMFKYFLNTYNPESIITYSDMRYFTGKAYEKIGFIEAEETQPNYFYFKNTNNLMSRIQFQKHKLESVLEKYDANMTEWENMVINKYDRIWDCGNKKYIWNKQLNK